MAPYLNIGDFIYVDVKKASDIRVGVPEGDILVIRGPNYFYKKGLDPFFFHYLNNNSPIIHRAIDKKKIDNKYYFLMKGDNNLFVDGVYKIINLSEDLDYFLIEYNMSNAIYISEDEILGVCLFKIPYLGYLKLYFPLILVIICLFTIFYFYFRFAGYRIRIIKSFSRRNKKEFNISKS